MSTPATTVKSGAGGYRPGSGRKPKADKYRAEINKAEKQIKDHLPALISNLLNLAEGVTIQEADKDGNDRIYTRAPDYKANEYLINRIMGKPTERQELTGEDGSVLTIVVDRVGIERKTPKD